MRVYKFLAIVISHLGNHFLLGNTEVVVFRLHKLKPNLSFSSACQFDNPARDKVLDRISVWLPAKSLFSLGSFISSFLEYRAKTLVFLNQTGLCSFLEEPSNTKVPWVDN